MFCVIALRASLFWESILLEQKTKSRNPDLPSELVVYENTHNRNIKTQSKAKQIPLK